MTIQQIKQDLAKLKEEAAKKPNLLVHAEEELKLREEMKKEIGELKAKMQYYIDGGVFDKEDHSFNSDFDINLVDKLSIDLVQRWKNRHNLRLEEGKQLYRDIGIFN